MSTDQKEGQQCFGKKEDGPRPLPHARRGFVLRFGFRWYRAWHGFWKDDCIDRAGLLSYTTLFGLIPLAVLVFSMWNLVGFSVSGHAGRGATECGLAPAPAGAFTTLVKISGAYSRAAAVFQSYSDFFGGDGDDAAALQDSAGGGAALA